MKQHRHALSDRQRFEFAVASLVDAVHGYWQKHRCEIGEPDLDDEQPVNVTVTLGQLRNYDRWLRTVQNART